MRYLIEAFREKIVLKIFSTNKRTEQLITFFDNGAYQYQRQVAGWFLYYPFVESTYFYWKNHLIFLNQNLETVDTINN